MSLMTWRALSISPKLQGLACWCCNAVGRCGLTASKPVLKAPMVSALEGTI